MSAEKDSHKVVDDYYYEYPTSYQTPQPSQYYRGSYIPYDSGGREVWDIKSESGEDMPTSPCDTRVIYPFGEKDEFQISGRAHREYSYNPDF